MVEAYRASGPASSAGSEPSVLLGGWESIVFDQVFVAMGSLTSKTMPALLAISVPWVSPPRRLTV